MRQPAIDQQMPLSGSDRGEIDLVALFREIGRRKWQVLACTLGAFILATATVNILKPRYTAETRLFLENRDTEYTRIGRDQTRGPDAQIDQDAVLSQVQIIQSRDIARTVIKRFDLGASPEFDTMREGVDSLTKLSVMLGLINNPATMSPEERVLEKYFDKLKAYAVAKSRVIAIEFQSHDPELAAKLTEAVAEEYILQLEQAKRNTAKSAGSWLGRTIETLRERVNLAEAKVESYRSQNGLFLVGSAGNGNTASNTISTQQLSELSTQLGTVRAQQTELLSKARLIREAVRQGRIFEVSDVVNNEIVRRLIEARATLKAQIAQEERSLLPQHPRIKELYAQLGGLEEQARSAAERTAKTLENDARAAGARMTASQAELDLQKRQNSSSSDQEVQLRALEREAKAERDQLENYLARYRDATVRDGENAVAADARIVSRATVPSMPSFPRKLPIILIATLAGLILSLFWVLTKSLLSERVYTHRLPDAVAPPQPMLSMMGGMMAPVLYTYAPIPSAPAATVESASSTLQMPIAGEEQSVTAHPVEPAVAEINPLSQTSQDMRASLDRMSEALSAARMPVETPAMIGTPAVIETQAPPLAPRTSDLSRPMQDESTETSQPPVAARPILGIDWKDQSNVDQPAGSLPAALPIDPDNPLFEIAEEAEACLIRGRPVTILVLSIESTDHATATMRVLDRILKQQGTVISALLDASQITPLTLIAASKSLAGNHDYAIFNGGAVDTWSRDLSQATTLTVLVASDDLDDPRTDEATTLLNGCNYFIVGAEAATSYTN